MKHARRYYCRRVLVTMTGSHVNHGKTTYFGSRALSDSQAVDLWRGEASPERGVDLRLARKI